MIEGIDEFLAQLKGVSAVRGWAALEVIPQLPAAMTK